MKGNLLKGLQKVTIRSVEEKFLLKGASRSFIIKTIGAILTFGVNILLGRVLGVENYGAYTYVYSWVTLFVVFISLGFDKSLLRFIPEYKNKEDWGNLKGILSFSLRGALMLSVVVILIAIFTIFLIKDRPWTYSRRLILLGIILLPFLGLSGIVSNALMGYKKVVAALIPQMIIVQIATALGVFILFFAGRKVSAEIAMAVKLVSVIIAFLLSLFFLRRVLPKELNEVRTKKNYRFWLSVSLPMLLVSGIYIVLNKADLIMIGLILEKTDVGIYGAVVKVSALILFGLQAINVVLAPIISETYYTQKYRELQKVVTLANRISFVIALTAACILFYTGKYILGFFGNAYQAGYYALMILSLAQVFNSFSGSTGYIMSMTGHQNMALKILGGSALVNLVLNYFLIPVWGIMGAAIATSISIILWNSIMIIYIRKRLKINATIF